MDSRVGHVYKLIVDYDGIRFIDTYMCAKIEPTKCILINIVTGNRYCSRTFEEGRPFNKIINYDFKIIGHWDSLEEYYNG